MCSSEPAPGPSLPGCRPASQVVSALGTAGGICLDAGLPCWAVVVVHLTGSRQPLWVRGGQRRGGQGAATHPHTVGTGRPPGSPRNPRGPGRAPMSSPPSAEDEVSETQDCGACDTV